MEGYQNRDESSFFSIIINDLFVKDSNASLQKKTVETKTQRYAK